MLYKYSHLVDAFQYGVDEEPAWFKYNVSVIREFNCIRVYDSTLGGEFGNSLDTAICQYFHKNDFIIRDFIGQLSVEDPVLFEEKYTKCEETFPYGNSTYLRICPNTMHMVEGVPHFTLVDNTKDPKYNIFGKLSIGVLGRSVGTPLGLDISEKTTKDILEEYEMSLWKPYPKELPENNHHYLVRNEKGQMQSMIYENDAWHYPKFTVIAYRELPKWR